jgi:hypothetical protein
MEKIIPSVDLNSLVEKLITAVNSPLPKGLQSYKLKWM